MQHKQIIWVMKSYCYCNTFSIDVMMIFAS